VPKPGGADNCALPRNRETAAASPEGEWGRKAEADGAAVTAAQRSVRLRAAQHAPTEASHTAEQTTTRRDAARRRALPEPMRSAAAATTEAANTKLHDHV